MAVTSAAAGLALLARHWLQPGDEAIVWDPVDFLLPHTVRAAGGVVTGLDGEPWSVQTSSTLSAAPGAHEEVLEILHRVGSPEEYR
jgi:fructose-1,6-bisphosphatase/inositol monophosphatase family enzyme